MTVLPKNHPGSQPERQKDREPRSARVEAPFTAPPQRSQTPRAATPFQRPEVRPEARGQRGRPPQRDQRSQQNSRPTAPVSAPPSRRPALQADASAFAELGLCAQLVSALGEEGYSTPTPIQRDCIPTILEGKDLLGSAQTGTGKTAAFTLPLLQRLGAPRGMIRALVVTPTRELAIQIAERTDGYGRNLKLSNTVVYGGVSQKRQEEQLARRPDVLIATPGRLLDLMGQRVVSLRNVEILVLDEADTMLDMGFIHDVRRILAEVPESRQTLLFSATLPAPIVELAQRFLRNPVRVSVAPQGTTATGISESVYFASQAEKRTLLETVLKSEVPGRTLIFSRTKHGANRIATQLTKAGIQASAIHGNKSQGARVKALNEFRDGSNLVLVATDIAARGIDVQGVSLVINYDLPNVPESYVHRIGRTARAGGQGKAIAFCDNTELGCLAAIEKLTQKKIPVAGGSPGAFVKSAAVSGGGGGGGGGGGHRQRAQGNQRRGSSGGGYRTAPSGGFGSASRPAGGFGAGPRPAGGGARPASNGQGQGGTRRDQENRGPRRR
ncbi:MAG: DEAD/DEAH box helicase [Polyangiaceae bacterium]|nr:DEAD/DEAH box helicase [Polyangiaceae bacterium]